MIVPLILLLLGVVMTLRPRIFSGASVRAKRKRLEVLQQGGEERYFEEARVLKQNFSNRFLLLWRLAGTVIAITGLILVLVRL